MNRTLALIFILPISAFALNEWHIQSDGFISTPSAEKPVIAYKSDEQFIAPQPIVNLTAPLNQLSNKAHDYLYKQRRLPKTLSDTAFSEFDIETLKTLKTGDQYILKVDEYLSYTVEITDIIEASNGDRSVFGKLNDHAQNYHQAVMTLTENTLHGQFNAGNENYQFESYGKYGWVTKL
ncbi:MULTISPECIES: hypothetical protein [Pseudoalteromonas]|uniref:Orphan protein n=1 Tax=Pseudoalteromonas lipolytica TaxID=570156 RepID=A0AAD0WED6_9GAMM|nr:MULTISPECIES: hypothetical protein [Pseudoalteromonas]AXV67357.1 hypothetical protein D0907_18795 [Pseudoalteromonas donghaensis]MBE0352693.1 hypothetical protein [Pseudoalteromonas lipolytica LMEB 39]MCC9660385.1 hypothetical protein [Pseudoalteromonas sp. MB41]QLJ10242.1 hypothetical protein GZH31_19670 [Pseudoalteromonas sp. JSTW]SFT39525.1 hypothetical protein SAMN04487854_102136 [Pseudoalteromonas lipolytica]